MRVTITVPIIDFGDVTIQRSPDNEDMLRLHIDDPANFNEAHVDMNLTEVADLIRALTLAKESM